MDEAKNEQQTHFEQVPVNLLEDTALTESEIVFYVLIVRLSSQKGYCYATNKYIGSLRRKNWRTAQRVIESLKKKNYIRVEVSDKYERKIFPLRYVKTDVGGTSILSWGYDITDAGGTSDLTKRYVKNDVKNNTKNNTKRISICANCNSHHSEISNSDKRSQGEKADKGKLFSQFWAAWPNKKNKKKAELAFCRIKNLSNVFPVMMQALEKQKATPQWQNQQFIPLPTTWINGERWNDEIETSAAAPADSSPWNHFSNQMMSEEERERQDQAARRAAGFED